MNQKKINDELYLPIKNDFYAAQRPVGNTEYEDYNKHINNSSNRTEHIPKGSINKDTQQFDGLQERSSSSSNTKANLK